MVRNWTLADLSLSLSQSLIDRLVILRVAWSRAPVTVTDCSVMTVRGYCCYEAVSTKFKLEMMQKSAKEGASIIYCRQSTSHTAMLAVKLYECFCWCYSTPTTSISELLSFFFFLAMFSLVLLKKFLCMLSTFLLQCVWTCFCSRG